MTLQWNEQEIKKHCERWRITELNNIISLFEDDFAESVHQKLVLSQDYKNIILRIVGKSVVTCSEILCLVTYGFPDGALSLARNLYEQSIILHFFERHHKDDDFEKYIHDYFIDSDIQRLKALLYDAEHFSQDNAEADKIKNKIKILREQAYQKGKGDYWWMGSSSFTGVVDANMQNLNNGFSKLLAEFHLLYKRACLSLHANGYGNVLRLGVENHNGTVNTAPQTNGHEIPLLLAVGSLVFIIGTACMEFDLDYEKYKQQLNDLLLFYRKAMRSDYANA